MPSVHLLGNAMREKLIHATNRYYHLESLPSLDSPANYCEEASVISSELSLVIYGHYSVYICHKKNEKRWEQNFYILSITTAIVGVLELSRARTGPGDLNMWNPARHSCAWLVYKIVVFSITVRKGFPLFKLPPNSQIAKLNLSFVCPACIQVRQTDTDLMKLGIY